MSKPKNRFIVRPADAGPPSAVSWRDVTIQRNSTINYIVWECTKYAEGTPAELAALPDLDAPKIEVETGDGNAVISCGEYVWAGDDWEKGMHNAWLFDNDLDAGKFAALLRKHKDYPAGGAQ
jgi:hypothetical protein